MNKNNYIILIADDDLSLNKAISISLTKKGYHILSTFNGTETLKIFEENNISLVLLDIMMPNQSGLEILKYIRTFSSVPIIMLTALGESWDKEKGFICGADDYITKPFSLKEVNLRIEALLRRS